MLIRIKIENLAVIDKTEISFQEGLNILSGETGAGKSIVLSAISLILGARADHELVRKGAREATIEGYFDLEKSSLVCERMRALGLECDPRDGLIVKRVVSREGKSRVFLNGQAATLTMLEQVCEDLIELCSQHEHQSLMRSRAQLESLDRYSGSSDLVANFSKAQAQYSKLISALGALERDEQQRLQREDFINFQLADFTRALGTNADAILPDQDEILSAEKKSLLSHSEILGTLEEAIDALAGESGALSHIQGAIRKLKTQKPEIAQNLSAIVSELETEIQTLVKLKREAKPDPERLADISEKLSAFAAIKRKYGPTLEMALTKYRELKTERDALGSHQTQKIELEKKISKSESELKKLAQDLSKRRRKSAKVFEDSVAHELQSLKMKGASLKIEFTPIENPRDYLDSGSDLIDFQVRTNPSDDFKPISKIASGGELSRLLLSIRRVIADQGKVGVYIFDEIDSGVSGQTAFEVGKKLKSVAKHNQVICITHLPQVAAFGDHHMRVSKTHGKAGTQTLIESLSQKAREQEIARMVAGEKLTQKSLENARELLSQST